MKRNTIMRMKYISPQMILEKAECCHVLTASVVSGNGIGFGGIDNDGSKDPSVKEFLWDKSDDLDE